MEGETREDASINSTSRSRRSSLRGPYREGSPVRNGFAFCNPVFSAWGSVESYSRSLLLSGNGYPIFEVAGDWTRSPLHLSRGPSLGDVGFMDGDDGRFIMMFNIFANANDPVHKNDTPSNFVPMKSPETTEVTRIPNHFPTGTVIATKGINIHRISDSPLEFTVSTSAREGGILVLPDGASREDFSPTPSLLKYIEENALKWYSGIVKMTRGDLDIVPNGLLYLITGVDKAPAVSCVAIPSVPERSGIEFEIRYKRNSPQTWSDTDPVRVLTYEYEENPGAKYGVFLRGIRIALNHRTWATLPYYSPPESRPYYNLLSTPITGLVSRIVRMIESRTGTRSTILTGRPQVPFHLSDILAQVILLEFPNSGVVLVDDSVWMGLVDPIRGDGTLSEIRKLLTRILLAHDVVLENKAARLVPKPIGRSPQRLSLGTLRAAINKPFDRRQAERKIKKVLNDGH